MPVFCGIVKCGSRSGRDNVHFYRLPAILNFKHKAELNELSEIRREKWLIAIRRSDLTDTKLKYLRVCSKHFISGKPADLVDKNNPDWVPSLLMGYKTHTQEIGVKKVARKTRLENRDIRKIEALVEPPEKVFKENVGDEPQSYINDISCDKISQTDLSNGDIVQLKLQASTNNILERKLVNFQLNNDYSKGDDVKTKYYTRIDTFSKLEIIVKYISKEYITEHLNNSLTVFQQILLTLMKLRLNLDFKDLGYRFNVSYTLASNYFKSIINIMYRRFKKLVFWPDRDMLLKALPSCFKESFNGKSVIIIDRFEIFIEKPSNMLTAAQCWSHYKHHYTVKYLIAITAQGTICFISEAWGGRTSDKHLTCESEFFNNILPGDIILADRGFLLKDYVRAFHANVQIPVFTRGKSQLHPKDIEETRSLAHVRIHVERVIGCVRQKYRILTDTLPITLISSDNLLDKIVVVCCSLMNLCPPIIPME